MGSNCSKYCYEICENASIYPLNVTQGALITPEMANIIDKQGTGQAKLIKPMIDFIMRTFIKRISGYWWESYTRFITVYLVYK